MSDEKRLPLIIVPRMTPDLSRIRRRGADGRPARVGVDLSRTESLEGMLNQRHAVYRKHLSRIESLLFFDLWHHLYLI